MLKRISQRGHRLLRAVSCRVVGDGYDGPRRLLRHSGQFGRLLAQTQHQRHYGQDARDYETLLEVTR